MRQLIKNYFVSQSSAINFASDGDQVSAASGNYFENINFRGRSISVIGSDGSTIDGGGNGSVVTFNSGEDTNSVLRNFIIQNGLSANDGGGIYISNSGPIIDNCIIENNISSGSGGGIYYEQTSNGSFLRNSQVINNTANGCTGGGILASINDTGPYLENVLITGNSTSCDGAGGGGGLYSNQSHPVLDNVTVINNTSFLGGGIYVFNGTEIEIMNTIIAGNYPQSVHSAHNDDWSFDNTLTISYSNIEGLQDSIKLNGTEASPDDTSIAVATLNWGSGNIDVNPMFVDTANGNYHLLASSMLINAGHPDSTDSDGTRTDIGSFPYLNNYTGPNWYVQTDGSDIDGTGASLSPFASIQGGINFSNTGNTVVVADGEYYENIKWRNVNGIKLLGSSVENCIIDGGGVANVISFNYGLDNGIIDTLTKVANFTIQNGQSVDGQYGNGAGINIDHTSSPLLENLLITNNIGGHGGGMFIVNGSSPLIRNVIIKDNIGSEGGGIAFMSGGSSKLENVLIHSNVAYFFHKFDKQ